MSFSLPRVSFLFSATAFRRTSCAISIDRVRLPAELVRERVRLEPLAQVRVQERRLQPQIRQPRPLEAQAIRRRTRSLS